MSGLGEVETVSSVQPQKHCAYSMYPYRLYGTMYHPYRNFNPNDTLLNHTIGGVREFWRCLVARVRQIADRRPPQTLHGVLVCPLLHLSRPNPTPTPVIRVHVRKEIAKKGGVKTPGVNWEFRPSQQTS